MAFGSVAVIAGLAALEGVGRLTRVVLPEARWEFERKLLESEGFPALSGVLEPDVSRFWRMRPGLDRVALNGSVDRSELSFTLSTDADGHRLMPQAPAGARTILFLGDSCTLGIGVDDDEAFPAVVQARMPGVRCVNAGVPGYTAFQGRVTLDEWTGDAPAAVVITFGINDDANWDGRSDLAHAAEAEAERSRWLNRSGLATLVRRVARPRQSKAANLDTSRPRLNEAEFHDELLAMIGRCRAIGAEPILVVWPYLHQLYQPGETWKQAVVRRLEQTAGVRVVDLVPVFRSRRDPSLFVDVVHAGPAGCDLVAETLVLSLQNALPADRSR